MDRQSNFAKGVAYHCGLLQYENQYWKQDGDILRGIMAPPKNAEGKLDYENGQPDYSEAVAQIRRILHPKNAEAERTHILNVLLDNLRDAKREKSPEEYARMLEGYRPLRDDLKALTHEVQPIEDGVADKASMLRHILKAPRRHPQEENRSQSAPNTGRHVIIETSDRIAHRQRR